MSFTLCILKTVLIISATSKTSLVRLATKPTINMELRSNKLICHTEGHPAPVVRYYDAFENEVSENDGILIKTPGFYECEGRTLCDNYSANFEQKTLKKSDTFANFAKRSQSALPFASNGIGIVAKGFKITRPNTLRKLFLNSFSQSALMSTSSVRTFVNIPSTSKNLELTAEAVHDVPLSVTWSKNNAPLKNTQHRFVNATCERNYPA